MDPLIIVLYGLLIFFSLGLIIVIIHITKNVNTHKKASDSLMDKPQFRNSKKIDGWKGPFYNQPNILLVSEKGFLYFHKSKRTIHITHINSYKVEINGLSKSRVGTQNQAKLVFDGAGGIDASILVNTNKVRKVCITFNIDDFEIPFEEFLIWEGQTSKDSHIFADVKNQINLILSTLETVEKRHYED